MSFSLQHKLKRKDLYSSLYCVLTIDEVLINIGCYFPDYNTNNISRPWNDIEYMDINGIEIQYCEWTDSSKRNFTYAYFVYDECIYTVQLSSPYEIEVESILKKLLNCEV